MWSEEVFLRLRFTEGEQQVSSVESEPSTRSGSLVEEKGEVTPEPRDAAGIAWRQLREAIAAATGRSVETVRLRLMVELD